MATYRDIYLIMRMRDETTRTLQNIGRGFRGLGKVQQEIGQQQERINQQYQNRLQAINTAQKDFARDTRKNLQQVTAARRADMGALRAQNREYSSQNAIINRQFEEHRVGLRQLSKNERAAMTLTRARNNEAIAGNNQRIQSLNNLNAQDERTTKQRISRNDQFSRRRIANAEKIRNADQALLNQRQAILDSQQRLIGGLQAGGQAAVLMGAGLAITGGLAVHAFNNMTNAAMEFSEQSRVAFAVSKDFEGSVRDIGDAVLSVATEMPIPLEDLQETMYRIMTALEFNLEDSTRLLQGFAEEAVVGNARIQDAARSTIAIMNAFQMTAEDLTRIQDMQFNTVRWGNLQYQELSTTIGRIIPAAVRVGQEIEIMGASLAFLTRQGLSAEMAATATARAFELFARPKAIEGLEEMGVNVRDKVTGEFRDLDLVLGEMSETLGDLTRPERAAALQDVFGGTNYRIQARRFLDLVLDDFEQFENILNRIRSDAGTFQDALTVAMEEPQFAADLLSNKLEVLSIEIGRTLVPIKLSLIQTVTRLVEWWNNLDQGTRELIIKIGAFGGVLATLSGIAIALTGIFAIMLSQIATMLVSFGSAATGAQLLARSMGLLVGGPVLIMAIVGALYLLIQHWDSVSASIRSVIDWWRELETVEQAAIILLAAVTTGLVGVTGAFGAAATAASGFATRLAGIAVANPILASIVAIVGTLTLVIGDLTSESRAVAQATDSLSDSLVDNMEQMYRNADSATELHDAIQNLNREQVVQNLIDEDIMEDARQIGVSLELMADAAMGNAGAQEILREKLESSGTGAERFVESFRSSIPVIGSVSDAIVRKTGLAENDAVAARRIADATNVQTQAVENSIEAYHEKADALGGVDKAISELIKYQQAGGPLTVAEAIHASKLREQVQISGELEAATASLPPELQGLAEGAMGAAGGLSSLTEEGESTEKWMEQFPPLVKEAFTALGEGFDIMAAYDDKLKDLNDAAQERAQEAADAFNEGVDDQIEALKDRDDAEAASIQNRIDLLEKSKKEDSDYYEEIESNFQAYMQTLEETLSDQRDWHRNLNEIRRIAGDEYADYLASQGPEYASLHAEIAEQEHSEIRKAAELTGKIQTEGHEAAIKRLERFGTQFVIETGEYNREAVAELAEELGVAETHVERILENSNYIQRQKFDTMIQNFDASAAEASTVFMRQMEELPTDLQEELITSEKAAEIFGGKFVAMFERSGLEGVANFLEHTEELPPELQSNLLQSQAVTEGFYNEFKTLLRTSGVEGRVELLKEMAKTPGMIDTLFSTDMIPTMKGQLEAMESLAGNKGRDIVSKLVEKLGLGVGDVSKVVQAYAKVMAAGLNPVIKEVGGEVIVHAASATPSDILAEAGINTRPPGLAEGKLPDEAMIQNAQRGLVQWAEPETGGEAFIPLSPGKRNRSIKIWEETGRRLGIDPEPTAAAKGMIRSFQDGGFNSADDIPDYPKITAQFPFGNAFAATANQRMADLQEKAENWLTTALMPVAGGADIGAAPGVSKMMSLLHQRFPGLPLISGLRPGAITATGNPSWHGKGRAVDVPPRMDVFDYIHRNFGANALELIFSPAGNRQLYRGRPHMFTGVTRRMHWDHIHWAMQNGGLLPGRGGGDKIPAMLEPGEFVMRKEAVDRLGPENLERMNFQGGGTVPSFSQILNMTGMTSPPPPAGSSPLDTSHLGQLIRDSMIEVLPTPGEEGLGTLSGDQLSNIRNAIQAIQAEVESTAALTSAKQSVADLRTELNLVTAELGQYQARFNELQEMGRVVSDESQLNWMQAQRRVEDLRAEVEEMQNPVRTIAQELELIRARESVKEYRVELERLEDIAAGVGGTMTPEDELAILRQRDQIDQLQESLSELRDPQVDTEAIESAQERVAEAQAAYETARASVEQQRVSVGAAKAEIQRVEQIIPALDNEVAKLLMRFEAEAKLADAQHELAQAEEEAQNSRQTLIDAEEALKEARDVGETSARDIRMTELELKIARQELREMTQESTVSETDLKVARLELKQAQQELNEQMEFGSLRSGDLRMKQLELKIAEDEALEARKNLADFTPEYYELEAKIEELRTKRTETENSFREAVDAVSSAEFGNMDAILGVIGATEELNGLQPESVEYFKSVGEAAGFSKERIDELLGSVFELNKINLSRERAIQSNIGGPGLDEWIARFGSVDEIRQRIMRIFRNRGVPYSYGLAAGETAEERFQRLVQEFMGGRSFESIRKSVGHMAAGMQHGGIALARSGGTLVNVGEAGQDEAIIPLPQNWQGQESTPKTEITVEEGALQVTIQGNVTEDAMPQLRQEIGDQFDKFLKELRGDWRSR